MPYETSFYSLTYIFTQIQGVSDLRDEKTGAPLTGVLVDPKTGKAVRKSVFVLFFQDSKVIHQYQLKCYLDLLLNFSTIFNIGKCLDFEVV